MGRSSLHRLIAAVAVAASAVACTACSTSRASTAAETSSSTSAADLGSALRRLPDTTVAPLAGGKALTLSQQRSTIISFWGSWCTPCKQEAPYLNQLATHHRVIGVEYGGETGAAVEAVKEFGLSFPQYYVDPADMATYHLPGIPVTVFVDHTGTVRHLQIGRFTSDTQAQQLATRYAS